MFDLADAGGLFPLRISALHQSSFKVLICSLKSSHRSVIISLFSIDVAATLELYCDGGNVSMLQKLDGVKNRMYAGLLWVSLRLPSISPNEEPLL